MCQMIEDINIKGFQPTYTATKAMGWLLEWPLKKY